MKKRSLKKLKLNTETLLNLVHGGTDEDPPPPSVGSGCELCSASTGGKNIGSTCGGFAY